MKVFQVLNGYHEDETVFFLLRIDSDLISDKRKESTGFMAVTAAGNSERPLLIFNTKLISHRLLSDPLTANSAFINPLSTSSKTLFVIHVASVLFAIIRSFISFPIQCSGRSYKVLST